MSSHLVIRTLRAGVLSSSRAAPVSSGGRLPPRHLSTVDQKTPIGIVGVGNVGEAVSRNLLRHGYNVAAMYDTDPKRGADLEQKVARASSAREVAESSDVVITCLPKPPHVEAAFSGADGLLAGFRRGAVWIDHSTTDYQQTIRYHKQVKEEKEVSMLEAPITGGMSALKGGTMVTYLGGEKPIADLVAPILATSYLEQIYLGPVGSALVTKVMSNMLCMLNALGMAEAMLVAQKSGVDLVQFWHAIRAGCGNSFCWETAGPSLFRGDYDPSFTIDLHCKDLELGYQMAKKHQVPIPLHGLVQQLSNQALYKYGPEVGCYAAQRLYEESCHQEVRADGFENWDFQNQYIDGSVVVRHVNAPPPRHSGSS